MGPLFVEPDLLPFPVRLLDGLPRIVLGIAQSLIHVTVSAMLGLASLVDSPVCLVCAMPGLGAHFFRGAAGFFPDFLSSAAHLIGDPVSFFAGLVRVVVPTAAEANDYGGQQEC